MKGERIGSGSGCYSTYSETCLALGRWRLPRETQPGPQQIRREGGAHHKQKAATKRKRKQTEKGIRRVKEEPAKHNKKQLTRQAKKRQTRIR